MEKVANHYDQFLPNFTVEKKDEKGKIISTEELKSIDATDEKGKKVKLVKLNDGRVALVKKGKGSDAEEALKVAGKDQDKYLTAMMSRTISIDGVGVLAEDLSEVDLDEYLRLQAAFAEINF